MPTYDYECTACGYNFEVFQKISDTPLTECPQCKKRVKRLIGGGTGIIFKGSGFYTTDYKKSSINTSTAGGNGKEKTTKTTPEKKKQETGVKTEK
jgi:putative FmdB family regulatory protein